MLIAVNAMSVKNEIIEQLKEIFSDPRQETQEGVLVAGGFMTPELLRHAYQHGIFPWPHEGYPLLWFCPDERGVIDFNELHLPKSFLKWRKNKAVDLKITMNRKFSEVVKNCQLAVRKGQHGTWINSEIEKNYSLLFREGGAFSVEVCRNETLVGGLYGVKTEKYWSCESMFHLEDNTSKLALVSLIEYLINLGHTWVDIQMVTSVCETFGGKLISKDEFLSRIGC
jgi:leucyl/phenylalanyl-tRNA---protein transferase